MSQTLMRSPLRCLATWNCHVQAFTFDFRLYMFYICFFCVLNNIFRFLLLHSLHSLHSWIEGNQSIWVRPPGCWTVVSMFELSTRLEKWNAYTHMYIIYIYTYIYILYICCILQMWTNCKEMFEVPVPCFFTCKSCTTGDAPYTTNRYSSALTSEDISCSSEWWSFPSFKF